MGNCRMLSALQNRTRLYNASHHHAAINSKILVLHLLKKETVIIFKPKTYHPKECSLIFHVLELLG